MYVDRIAPGYDEYALPRELSADSLRGGIGKIAIIGMTQDRPAECWYRKNFGLGRYAGVLEIVNRHIADDPVDDVFDGATVVLTTGSDLDLDRQSDYPWMEKTRGFYKALVDRKVPTLSPCFGLAMLVQAVTGDIKTAFPKGIRSTGRKQIDISSRHRLFEGIDALSAYTHHNGAVPWETIDSYADLSVHALSHPDNSTVNIPAVVEVGSKGVIGVEFHREILDAEIAFLYSISARKCIGRLIEAAFWDMPNARSILDAEDSAQAVQTLQEETLTRYDPTRLIELTRVTNDKLDLQIPVPTWLHNYIRGTTMAGEQGYSPNASKLFFDNFLRIAIDQLRENRES